MTKKAAAPAPTTNPIVKWKDEPDEHDYPAAENYLTLIASPDVAKQLVAKLQKAPVRTHKAKDILRAACLDLLPLDNAHVAEDLRKVIQGIELSPVLIIRGNIDKGLPTTIADGYHRVCASHHLDENTDIPSRIIDL